MCCTDNPLAAALGIGTVARVFPSSAQLTPFPPSLKPHSGAAIAETEAGTTASTAAVPVARLQRETFET